MKMLLISVLIVIALSSAATADDNRFGLGIILGEPTGIGGKLFMTKRNAIDGAVAWSITGDNEFHIHGDYLFHNYNLFVNDKMALPMHFGIGGRIKYRENEDDLVGIRFPVGLNYLFDDSPFDIFFEIVPIMDLAPDTDFDMNAAVGGRFYF
jgi:hypothetical protein